MKFNLILLYSLILMILAGIPATIAFSGTGLLTTAFAPIIELSPTTIPPKTIAPFFIETLSPTTGTPG